MAPKSKRSLEEMEAIARAIKDGTKQGQTIGQAATSQGINVSMIYKWMRRYKTINEILARTIYQRMSDGMIKQRTIRTCLCCDHDFLSEGIHNRICGECKGNNPRIAGNMEAYV